MPRSTATQHISLLYTYCRRSLRTSQIDESGSSQRLIAISTMLLSSSHNVALMTPPKSRVHVCAVEHLAVHVELELIDRGVADAHRFRSAISLEMVEDVLGGMRVSAEIEEIGDVHGLAIGDDGGA